ncbi:cysteine peptidase family C39 domain-containing protein [Desulfovibrio piger]|nr:cysteine peptidase family C39 domain-containing protein [Desulfovibrio piger]
MLQMEATECGAACLGMILAYYGRYEPLEVLREACGVSRNGSRASLILRAARAYGLEAGGCRVLTEDLDRLRTPMILFWNFDHFVVYEGRSRNGRFFYINDPASGPRKVPRELFEASFTGVALTFSPSPDFRKEGRPFRVAAAVLPMLKGLRAIMAAVICGGLLLVVPGMVIPALMRVFVDEVLHDKSQWLGPLLLLFALTLVLQLLLEWLVRLALRRGELQTAVNQTLGMLRHVFRLPISFFLLRTSADIQNRIGMNSDVAATAFGSLADTVVKFFTAIFFLALMLRFSVLLSGLAVFFACVNLLFLFWLNRRRQVLNQTLQMEQTRLLSSLMSGVSMMENLRAAGREDAMFLQWTGRLAEANRSSLQFQVSTTWFNLLPTFLGALGNVLILCVGAWQIMDGALTLGGLFAFQTLMGSFTGPFTALVLAASEVQVLKADMERIRDVRVNGPDTVFAPSGEETAALPDGERVSLELRHVTFGYSRADPPVLRDVSLRLETGRRVAVVGASGSGKSSVARLAGGLAEPWEGEVMLNGRPLRAWSREQFYATVACVDQEIMLFSGSLRENLTLFAARGDAGELQEALRDVCLEDELALRGTHMLELPVSEGGANFSGGQRQRLEIARVLARRTPVLILDEATSALDPVTEVAIDAAVRRRGCACLVVAHRLSTIRDCDEILMLEDGRVIERGTHDELMRRNGAYAELMRLEQGMDA